MSNSNPQKGTMLYLNINQTLKRYDDNIIIHDINELSNDYLFIVIRKNVHSIINSQFKQKIENDKKYEIVYASSYSFYLLNNLTYQQYVVYEFKSVHDIQYHTQENMSQGSNPEGNSLFCDSGTFVPLSFDNVKCPAIILCDSPFDACNYCKGDISYDPIHCEKYTFKKIYEFNEQIIFIMDYRKHLVKAATINVMAPKQCQ